MEYEIKPKSTFNLGFRELYEFRELIYFFTWRDIKVKYKQTVLGALWAILQPLLLMLIFTLFFSKTLKINTGEIPYPVFVFSGLLIWNFFATSLMQLQKKIFKKKFDVSTRGLSRFYIYQLTGR